MKILQTLPPVCNCCGKMIPEIPVLTLGQRELFLFLLYEDRNHLIFRTRGLTKYEINDGLYAGSRADNTIPVTISYLNDILKHRSRFIILHVNKPYRYYMHYRLPENEVFNLNSKVSATLGPI